VRIAVNAQSYESGLPAGIGKYTEYLYEHIWAIDTDNEYVFFSNRPAPGLKERGRDRVTFRSAPSPLANKYVRVGWENFVLPIHLFVNTVHLVHCVNYFLPLMIPSRIKKVVTVHDLIWLKFPDYFSKDTVYTARKRFQHACMSADAIIAVSENTKNDILEASQCKEEKVIVIYEGVDNKRFNKAQRDSPLAQTVRQKYRLPDHFILWVGAYRKHKNVERLCKAVAEAKKRCNLPHKLVLCGPNLLFEEAVRALLKVHENDLVVIGPVSDEELPVLYSMADVFAFPSLYEGFGLPILEAMASGVPVITSNVSSLPEIARDASILVNPLDVDEIARALIIATTDETVREILITKGLERACEFSWEDTAHKTLEIFYRLGFE
jgi:glycosyltransferase involved in cell wall biosynthesis